MIRHTRNSILRAACLALLISCLHIGHTHAQPPSIPEAEITSLQQGTAAQTSGTSATKKRRACKSSIRKANSLIEATPTAANRFSVLSIILQSQRRLLTLDNSEKNRDALYATCSKLVKAPDSYAKLRLEADLILSEKQLSEKKANVTERAQALTSLVQRYRNTSAEAQSLKMAILIAPKLDAFELEQQFLKTLSERFQSDHDVIDYRRKLGKSGLLDVIFAGNYKRTDGITLSFPIDCMGHTSLLYFWSQDTKDITKRFAEAKAIQTKFPGRFRVFSFNLDELPDAGEKSLRENGLDWTAMHFPGGKNNPAYGVYINTDPGAVVINAQGHSQLVTALMLDGIMPLIPQTDGKKVKGHMGAATPPTLELCLDSFRYLSQLQALFIGDFLVAEKPKSAPSIPAATMDAIQACFTSVPQRYRISTDQALANYTKADQLCQAAIKQHPDAADLWQIRNRRIIALLGMWNLATEPKHLETAVQEAQTSLATTLPPGANVVPHFCLAKNNLRLGKTSPTSVLESFVKATGADEAPAIAAAALLAMDANDRDFHAKYREALLKLDNDNPALWPVVSFLRDRNHTYRAFRASYSRFGFSRGERHAIYRNAASLDDPADSSRVIKTPLTTLDGKTINLPQATDGKMTFVAFIELPSDEQAEAAHQALIKKISSMVDEHPAKRIKLIAAFLSNDKDKITAFAKKHQWTCEVAMVPNGLDNPLVAKYGILSADLTPNIFLLRPDGSISWSISGLRYQVQGQGGKMTNVIGNGIDAQLNVLQYETAKSALDQGDFKKAVKLFSEVLAPKKLKGDWWATFRFYCRARAYVSLKDWEAALADIDVAIEAHQTFAFGKVHRCELHKEMEIYKADILKQLGRDSEAKALRIKAAAPTTPHNKSPFGIYTDDNRKNFRLNPHQGK
jgi:tetratricopeptide (TPR) repeat protein